MDLLQNITVGFATSSTSLFLVQPLYALKTARQNHLHFRTSPKILWSGYSSNVMGDSSNFTCQYLSFQNKDKTFLHHAIVGGIAGGFIANISEQFMDHHRLEKFRGHKISYSQSFKNLLKNYRFHIFTRGLPFTTIREISYNYAWSEGLEKVQNKFDQMIAHPLLSKSVSSLVSGTCLTLMNHPFDTLKSKIHNGGHVSNAHFIKEYFKPIACAGDALKLVKESYRGAFFRTGIISISLFLSDPLIKTYTKLYKT